MICISWVALLLFIFTEHEVMLGIRNVVALDFFVILFAQTLLYDYQDAHADLSLGHTTLSNSIPTATVEMAIYSLYFASLLILAYGYLKEYFNLHFVFFNAGLYVLYNILIVHSFFRKNRKQIWFSDNVLLAKALLYALYFVK